MNDIAQLREALGPYLGDQSAYDDDNDPILDAARELLTLREAGALIIVPDERKVIAWCNEHAGAKFKGYPWCQRASDASQRRQVPPCSFVDMLLIPFDVLRDDGRGFE